MFVPPDTGGVLVLVGGYTDSGRFAFWLSVALGGLFFVLLQHLTRAGWSVVVRRIAEAIQSGGSLAFAHLNHAGRAANPKAIGGPPEAPSAVACPSTGATPEAMDGRRIRQIVAAYGAAARRARERQGRHRRPDRHPRGRRRRHGGHG